MEAPDAEQEATLNGECYSIGRLAGSGGVPTDLALDVLLIAARAMRSYNPRRRWRPREIQRKDRRAFTQGLTVPRPTFKDIERWLYEGEGDYA